MSDPSLATIVQTLEQSWVLLETGQGQREQHKQAIQGCLTLLLEHPPERIIEAARGSFLPARALVSWMVFEAERMEAPGPARAQALRQSWSSVEAAGGGSILPPPPDQAISSH